MTTKYLGVTSRIFFESLWTVVKFSNPFGTLFDALIFYISFHDDLIEIREPLLSEKEVICCRELS